MRVMAQEAFPVSDRRMNISLVERLLLSAMALIAKVTILFHQEVFEFPSVWVVASDTVPSFHRRVDVGLSEIDLQVIMTRVAQVGASSFEFDFR